MKPEQIRAYVENYFAKHPWILPPRHVLVILDRIAFKAQGLLFSGLQPSWLPDTIIVSWPLLRDDTLLHETLHTYGLGERGAWTLAPLLTEFRKRFPPIIQRRPRYAVCQGGPRCPYQQLHSMLGSKLVHLVKQD